MQKVDSFKTYSKNKIHNLENWDFFLDFVVIVSDMSQIQGKRFLSLNTDMSEIRKHPNFTTDLCNNTHLTYELNGG